MTADTKTRARAALEAQARADAAEQRRTQTTNPYAYPIPDQFASDAQAYKLAHQDLAGMDDLTLLRERLRVEFTIAWTEPLPEWVLDRYVHVIAETELRQHGYDADRRHPATPAARAKG